MRENTRLSPPVQLQCSRSRAGKPGNEASERRGRRLRLKLELKTSPFGQGLDMRTHTPSRLTATFPHSRSLVALSLILSLLLFKPAPLYILDEVDAALDLSHTQNIGQMLRTHFRHSQFIVVSLKDGMFNNANVLFKTKFVDGVSTVTRYASVINLVVIALVVCDMCPNFFSLEPRLSSLDFVLQLWRKQNSEWKAWV